MNSNADIPASVYRYDQSLISVDTLHAILTGNFQHPDK